MKKVYIWYMSFEFDPIKNRSNKLKHGIDFNEAQELRKSPHFEFPLKTEGESRWAIIETINTVFWTAIITKRRSNTNYICKKVST